MKTSMVKGFLDAFFEMLDLIIISYGQINSSVFGILTGVGSDVNELWQHQNFYWLIDKSESELSDLVILCKFLNEKNLINGDNIIISENELIERIGELGWNNEKGQKVVDDLFSIEIKMIDEGEATDSFFVHL